MSAADYFFVLSAIYTARVISQKTAALMSAICCILGVIAWAVTK